jgi:hypothetical protein
VIAPPDHDRTGGGVRLFGDAGMHGAARGGRIGRSRQQQPGDDHDGRRHRRPRVYRTNYSRIRSGDHPEGASRRNPGRTRRPDGAQHGSPPRGGRHSGRTGNRAARDLARFDPEGRGPGAFQADDAGSRGKVPHSTIVTTMDDAVSFRRPRRLSGHRAPAYTLGGTGGGVAHTLEEFLTSAARDSSSA